MMVKNKLMNFVFGIIIFTFVFMNIGFREARGGTVSTSNIKGIVVLDASKSMAKTDPANIRVEAFKLFVDMCRQKGDKIGLVTYANNVLKDTGLRALNTAGDKEALKKEVSSMALASDTDIGFGLKKAVDTILSSEAGMESPLIILLSDGKNEPARSKEESERDLESSIEAAKQKGLPIYTIGLNADGTVDEKLLQRISAETGGKSIIANSPKDLPEIFGQIFADKTQSNPINAQTVEFGEAYSEVSIAIPDKNVVEGNIIVTSDKALKDIKLFGKDGTEINLNGENGTLAKSEKYNLIKLLNPKQESYVLKLKGEKGNKAVVKSIFSYDLKLSLKYTPEKDVKKGDSIKVSAELQINGTPLKDENFYKELKGKLLVKETQTGKSSEVELVNKGGVFEGEYKVLEEGNYEFKVRLDGNSLYRESDIFKFSIAPTEPVSSNNPVVEPPKSEKLDLNTVFMIGGGALALILLVILMALRKSRKKLDTSRKVREKIKETAVLGSFSGQFMISIKSGDTADAEFPPFFRRLNPDLKQITLYELLSELPEFKETESVIFVPGAENSVILRNQSKCLVEKNTLKIEKDREIKLQSEEKISIALTKTAKVIYIQYFAGEQLN